MDDLSMEMKAEGLTVGEVWKAWKQGQLMNIYVTERKR